VVLGRVKNDVYIHGGEWLGRAGPGGARLGKARNYSNERRKYLEW